MANEQTQCWRCESPTVVPNQILCASCLRDATLRMEQLIDAGQLVFTSAASSLDATLTRAQTAEAAVAEAKAALGEIGRCTRCKGDGSPQCVSCDDYQACRCRPGEGRYADKCWACKGTGISNRLVSEALARIDEHPTQEAVDVNAIRRVVAALVALAKVQYDGTVEGLREQIRTEDWGNILPYAAQETRAAYELTLAILADPAIRPYLEGKA